MTRTQRQAEALRQGEACIEVRDPTGRSCAGVPVWIEQETHDFVFGCVVPALETLAEADRQRYTARAADLFNSLMPRGAAASAPTRRFDVPPDIHLGRLRLALDRMAGGGVPLDLYVRGATIGLGPPPPDTNAEWTRERAAAERIASLYTFCFAHAGVRGVFWEGFWDGEPGAEGSGLVRSNFAPRLAYRFLHYLIGKAWHSRAQGKTDANGRFCFRGYFGDYRVAAWSSEEASATLLYPFRRTSESAPFILSLPAAPSPAS